MVSYNPLTVDTNSGRGSKGALIALAAGIGSAILTILGTRVVEAPNPWLGFVFGAAIVGLIWFRTKISSWWFALAVIGSSAACYSAAIWGSASLTGLLNQLIGKGGNNSIEIFGWLSFSIAGFIGAFLFILTLLLLLTNTSGGRLAGTAAAWACAGAALGFLASLVKEPLGTAVATVFGGTDFLDIQRPFYSAHLIWQTGMALMIPLMLSRTTTSMPRSPSQLSLLGRIFFSCILATVALLAIFTVRDGYRSWNAVKIKAAASLRYNPLTSRK